MNDSSAETAGGRLPLQEALRILGRSLEDGLAQEARLDVGADGIDIAADGGYGQRHYTWAALASRVPGHQSQRRPGPRRGLRADPFAITKWSVLLRLAGALLDVEGVQTCTIEAVVRASPDACELVARDGDRVVLDLASVRQYIQWLRRQQSASDSDKGPTRPRAWWAFWQRR